MFTPMKIGADIKPKIEPESPTPRQTEPVVKPKPATKKGGALLVPKMEQEDNEVTRTPEPSTGTSDMDSIDKKPDIRALGGLLSSMELEA
jgi:hypothetical protein